MGEFCSVVVSREVSCADIEECSVQGRVLSGS